LNDRRVFHVGDALFSRRQLTRRLPLGSIATNFADDLDAAQRTLELLRALHDAHPDWIILCSHDPELGDAAADGPVEVGTLL
jgi:glyoxylase-like metal-dependent hydrolase (beta-lactamase superfamily II)